MGNEWNYCHYLEWFAGELDSLADDVDIEDDSDAVDFEADFSEL